MHLVWSHFLWFYFLNRGDEVPGEEKWEEFNMCKNFSSPHCATTLEMLKISGYCCSHCQKCWEAEGRKVSLLDFSMSLPSVPENLKCVECTGQKELCLEHILCCCRSWENSSGETQQASTEVTAVLTQHSNPQATDLQRIKQKVQALEPGASITGLPQVKREFGEEERIHLTPRIRIK